jgi:transcription initiation factor IIE alpha subunit
MSDYYSQTIDYGPLFAQQTPQPATAEPPLARRSDPTTSKIAGREARKFKGEHERRILEALAAGPGTKDEIASRCGLSEQQVARRMHGLARAGLVQTTGTTRPSASGRPERVWQTTAASR